MSEEAGFLNVDLEVGARTRAQLAPLIDALHGKLFELFRGRIRGLYRAHFETPGCARSASATVHELADVLEGLSASARRVWDVAPMREFNVGVELERGVRSIEIVLDPAAVRRVAALGGRIAFTAYQLTAMKRGRLVAARPPAP